MGYHTFTAGEVLTAANVNTFLMDQAVIVCTSGTRPTSPTAGMTIFETDTGNLNVWNGTSWVPIGSVGAWTENDTFVVNGMNGNYTRTSRYKQIGKTIQWVGQFTTSGASAGQISVGLPVTALGLGTQKVAIGSAVHVVTFGSSMTGLIAIYDPSLGAMVFQQGNAWLGNTGAPLASGEVVTWTVTFEAA